MICQGVGRYKYNKKLGIAHRLEGYKLASPIANPRTGEVMALADEVITREKAFEIENAGVTLAYVKSDDDIPVKVISNGMVDINVYVDFNAEEECGINEKVRASVLFPILEECETEEELKDALIG